MYIDFPSNHRECNCEKCFPQRNKRQYTREVIDRLAPDAMNQGVQLGPWTLHLINRTLPKPLQRHELESIIAIYLPQGNAPTSWRPWANPDYTGPVDMGG
jgi:hypothetical protein